MTNQHGPSAEPTGDAPEPNSQATGRWITVLHRAVAAVLGVGLGVFGVLGLLLHLPFLSVTGQAVFGLPTNGLLSVVSLVAAVVLVGAAAVGGSISSTVTTLMGVVFLVSGIGHLLVLGTRWNVFGFSLANVLFSLVVGLILLAVGMYGRFSGALPSWNPYLDTGHARTPHLGSTPASTPAEAVDPAAVPEMADAELAIAEGHETPRQRRLVHADAIRRAQRRRRQAWRHYLRDARRQR